LFENISPNDNCLKLKLNPISKFSGLEEKEIRSNKSYVDIHDTEKLNLEHLISVNSSENESEEDNNKD